MKQYIFASYKDIIVCGVSYMAMIGKQYNLTFIEFS